MQERWLNKSMSFNYNGTNKSITFTVEDLATVKAGASDAEKLQAFQNTFQWKR